MRLFKRKPPTAEDLKEACYRFDIDRVKKLIEYFIKRGELYNGLHNPKIIMQGIYAAITYPHYELLLLLLDAGWDPTFREEGNGTPIHIALDYSISAVRIMLWYCPNMRHVLGGGFNARKTVTDRIEELNDYPYPGYQKIIADTERDFANAKRWMAKAETYAKTKDYTAAAAQLYVQAANIFDKQIEFEKKQSLSHWQNRGCPRINCFL